MELHEIAKSSEKARHTTDDAVSRANSAYAKVDQSAQEMSSGSSQVQHSATQLSGLAHELLAQVSRFKIYV